MNLIFFIDIGVLFALIGLGVIIGGLVYQNSIKNSREVNAKIVEVIETNHRNDSYTYSNGSFNAYTTYYTPVYEYYDGGEVKRYKSSVSSSVKKSVGMEEMLYISEDGKVRTNHRSIFMFLFGGIFAFVGIVLAVAGLFLSYHIK